MDPSGRYLLGDSPAEIRHLVEPAETYAEEATELLDRIGVDPSNAAIDVGCGVLGILHLLADRVGPQGRVVGLDREARMVDAGRQFAEQHRLPIEFIHADATATGLPENSFDLVHARTCHRGDPRARRCGLDLRSAAPCLRHPPRCRPQRIGRRAHRLLQDAGLLDVQVRPTARVTQVGQYYQTFLLAIASLVHEPLVDNGDLTADEVDSYAAALRVHLETPGTITCQPIIWQAWGRTPPRR